MNFQAIFEESIRSITSLLNVSLETLSWAVINNAVDLIHAQGAPFTDITYQEHLKQHLPEILQPGNKPQIIHNNGFDLPNNHILICLPCRCCESKHTPQHMVNLLFTIPQDAEITTSQWEGLKSISTLTSIALLNFPRQEKCPPSETYLQAVVDMGAQITGLIDREDALLQIVTQIAKAFNYDYVGIFLVSDDGEYATLEATSTKEGPMPQQQYYQLRIGEQCIVGHVIGTGEAEVTQTDNRTLISKTVCALPDTRSEMAVPMRHRGQIVGALDIQSKRPQAFDGAEMITLQAIADQTANALINARLLSRLRTQTLELQWAYEEAQHLNVVRNQMLQNVSHELRTPLGLILGYTEMLKTGAIGPLTPQQADILRIIHSRTCSLNRMVQGLTTLQGKVQIENSTAISLKSLIPQVIQEFKKTAQRQGIQFYLEIPPHMPLIPGDIERLHLAMSHLVENAIKFSPKGGTIIIRSWMEKDEVVIAISDQGIGIPDGQLTHIFEPFYQVDGSSKRRYGGMGIGLALVWEIVEAHRGYIEVESEPEIGSTFIVHLPLINPLKEQQD